MKYLIEIRTLLKNLLPMFIGATTVALLIGMMALIGFIFANWTIALPPFHLLIIRLTMIAAWVVTFVKSVYDWIKND